MKNEKVCQMDFTKAYPLLVNKAVRKGQLVTAGAVILTNRKTAGIVNVYARQSLFSPIRERA